MHPGLIAFAIVIVILLVYIVGRKRSSELCEYTAGAWIAPDEFCEEAELQSLMIVLAEPESTGFFGQVKQLGHIVATPNAINTSMTLTYNRGASLSSHKKNIHATVEFDDGPLWGESNPTECVIEVDMTTGRMIIRNDTTVFASLFKENNISDLIKDVEAADADVDPPPQVS